MTFTSKEKERKCDKFCFRYYKSRQWIRQQLCKGLSQNSTEKQENKNHDGEWRQTNDRNLRPNPLKVIVRVDFQSCLASAFISTWWLF